MKTLHTQIEIDAPAERVWDTLTNTADYPTWNLFIPRITGTLASGERLEVRIAPPGGAAMTAVAPYPEYSTACQGVKKVPSTLPWLCAHPSR
jgi:uncharacterized protein YndB with AHSA1/START domain